MPTKKKSCDLVQQGVAGPTPDQILEAIKAEYWLPTSTPRPREATKDAAQPGQPAEPTTDTQVKP